MQIILLCICFQIMSGRIYIRLWGVQGTRKEDSLFHFYPAIVLIFSCCFITFIIKLLKKENVNFGSSEHN